jgi:hypothetical protein
MGGKSISENFPLFRALLIIEREKLLFYLLKGGKESLAESIKEREESRTHHRGNP